MIDIDPQYQFLSMKDLKQLLGKSAPSIYRWISEGSFPRPVKLGGNSSGWRLSDYEGWAADPDSYRSEAN
jgi:prophage regulatory protein